jgi:hypothetical protein
LSRQPCCEPRKSRNDLALWGATREAAAASLVTQALARMMETPGFAQLLRETLKRRREE